MTHELEQHIKKLHEQGGDYWMNIKDSCEILGISRYKFNKLRDSGVISNGCQDGFVCGLGRGFYPLSLIESLVNKI